MNKEIADITVLAANYNNGPYLRHFIESILASKVLPRSILIVDDGSTDESRDILGEYVADPMFNIVFLPNNEGFGHALNHGIERISTKYILRADPDDLFLPERIGEQWQYLEAHPGLSGIGCNVEYFQGRANRRILNSRFPTGKEAVDDAYRRGLHGIQHPTALLRTEALGSLRYRQENVPAEDYDLFARMVAAGHRFDNLPQVLYRMRIHSGSASSNLNFSTIHKTFQLRKEIFGRSTSLIRQRAYYLHILAYRRGLLCHHRLFRFVWFLLSALLRPSVISKRILRVKKITE